MRPLKELQLFLQCMQSLCNLYPHVTSKIARHSFSSSLSNVRLLYAGHCKLNIFGFCTVGGIKRNIGIGNMGSRQLLWIFCHHVQTLWSCHQLSRFSIWPNLTTCRILSMLPLPVCPPVAFMSVQNHTKRLQKIHLISAFKFKKKENVGNSVGVTLFN